MKRIVLSALVVGVLFISASVASVRWTPSGLDAPTAVRPNVPTPAPPQSQGEPTPQTQVEQRLHGKVIYVTVDIDRP